MRLRKALSLTGLCAMAILASPSSYAGIQCEREVTANIVAFDKPLMWNRLGASNVNGLMFALRRDVIALDQGNKPLTAPGVVPTRGQVDLRPDKRHRPLILRVRRGDCLTVTLQNLLTDAANPNEAPLLEPSGQLHTVTVDDQVTDRHVSFHASGLQLVNGIDDDGSMVGRNPGAIGSLLAPGQTRSYKLFAQKEGVFLAQSEGATFGSEGSQGNSAHGLFGQAIVEPTGARIYRSQVYEEELRLATTGATPGGQPIIDYEATYPVSEPWIFEGKAGLPVLNTMKCDTAAVPNCEIVHSEINGVIAGPNADGSFPASTYPLESVGKRNPTVPNRLEPFRDFASAFHDEVGKQQAFPGFFDLDPVFSYVLHGVVDNFMINYGSGGIGSEIIANRLGVGPMHDCLTCAYEEFFLTSWAVSDPGLTVDIPANLGLENLRPGQAPPPGTTGPKANYVIGAEDPSNVHHSYTNDFVKFRNTHIGKEQHIFHLHNHQWLYNAGDDNSNYLDAQGIGPGVGYTYEINFGGSGNRNKTAGDAIFHCHFYPHFAQGMWYLWRNHDVFEAGTKLAASGAGFHTTPWALANTTPAAGARALPDGEIFAGTPIPALVPLPGKAMALVPGKVEVVTRMVNGIPRGSVAHVIERDVNPGFPFWLGGIEEVVGQRPPTPVLDMVSPALASALQASGDPLWANLDPAQADGWDGGLPRHALLGVSNGGAALSTVDRLDFSKVITKAKPVFFPEEGTDVEQTAMKFHAIRNHPSFAVPLDGPRVAVAANFVSNGSGGPAVGAPFHEPCIDDAGRRLNTGVVGNFFDANLVLPGQPQSLTTHGSSVFSAQKPRIYKASVIQFDAVLNKAGYHYQQQRIITLWQDAVAVIGKQQAPEPFVMRLNTFDCAVFHHTNLVPEVYEMDDYQVRTPTDIIGQHIHLPKWDLTTTDGSGNGWNYEDGTHSPGAVRERIEAINAFNADPANTPVPTLDGRTHLEPVAHPFFGQFGRADWIGARTTTQRWFADPVVNTEGTDRGLGIIFTHDHFGPSTHQQIGLYSTLLTEPAGSRWAHNETGQQIGQDPVTGAQAAGRFDGGPTSWQVAILTPGAAPGGSTVKSETLEPFREFYFEYSDFQHAYEAGVYVGTGPDGRPLGETTPGVPTPGFAFNAGNPDFDGTLANAFRFAFVTPARAVVNEENPFPDLVIEPPGGVVLGCPSRPCPTAIDASDNGLYVVNYRQEPVGLRVYDPNKIGPDGRPGQQADGERGDLAFALQSRTDRAIAAMNRQPQAGDSINGTVFPPPINAGGVKAGDPFTAMVRTYVGDFIRVKMQAGGDEEEHNATIHGMKWLQGGSGHGRSPNSGWRNAQSGGISEQFTLAVPVVPSTQNVGSTDYFYSMDPAVEGWWNGMWGIMRAYNAPRNDLFQLPTTRVPVQIANAADFRRNRGACPDAAPVRPYDITAVLANNALPNALGVFIPTPANTTPGSFLNSVATQHVGGPLNPNGGTLVYNHRPTVIPGTVLPADVPGAPPTVIPGHNGPIHDPTAIMLVRTADLNAGKLIDGRPVEPVIIRAAAGECVQVILRNRLPALANVSLGIDPATGLPITGRNSTAPDLATLGIEHGVVKRLRFEPNGATYFNSNLIRPSSWVGITPQLVAFDPNRDSGIVIGENASGQALVEPGQNKTYFWYAGDIAATKTGGLLYTLVPTAVELGGANILPADRVKQGAKSLVGGIVIEPANSTWVENTQVFDHQDGVGTRLTRTQATVDPTPGQPNNGDSFRDFSVVLTKNLTQYFKGGEPVGHLAGEDGIPEDPQDGTNMALNYGIEPLWFRFGLQPDAPLNKGHGTGTNLGEVANAHEAYSNGLPVPGVGSVHGDPVTPVFTVAANTPFRMRITDPHGGSRTSVFTLHGHVWQRDPYVCPGQARNGLTGACNMTSVGSLAIGNNPQGFAEGGRDSWTPASHFDIVLDSAGGGNGVKGDYLFRDQTGFGNTSGIWGLVRVQ